MTKSKIKGHMRIPEWFDTEKKKVMYGLQIKDNGKWLNCCEGSKALLFDTPKEAEEKMLEYAEAQGWL